MRQEVAALWHRIKDDRIEKSSYVSEYFDRLELAKLGYHDDLNGLSAHKAECFMIISNRIMELQKKQADERASKAKARKPRRR